MIPCRSVANVGCVTAHSMSPTVSVERSWSSLLLLLLKRVLLKWILLLILLDKWIRCVESTTTASATASSCISSSSAAATTTRKPLILKLLLTVRAALLTWLHLRNHLLKLVDLFLHSEYCSVYQRIHLNCWSERSIIGWNGWRDRRH